MSEPWIPLLTESDQWLSAGDGQVLVISGLFAPGGGGGRGKGAEFAPRTRPKTLEELEAKIPKLPLRQRPGLPKSYLPPPPPAPRPAPVQRFEDVGFNRTAKATSVMLQLRDIKKTVDQKQGEQIQRTRQAVVDDVARKKAQRTLEDMRLDAELAALRKRDE